MIERQREGIAKAKAEGKFKGAKRTFDHDALRRLAITIGAEAAAKELGMHRGTAYRILAQERRTA